MDESTRDCIEKQISSLEVRLEKTMSDKFTHLEKLMRQVAGSNDKEHERMGRQIGELYEENKRDRADVDKKIERVVTEFDAKNEAQSVRIMNLEQRQSTDEGGAKAKEMSQKSMIGIIGLMFAGIKGLEVLLSLFGG